MVAFGPHGRLADSWWTTTAPTTLNTGTSNTIVGIVLHFAVPGRVFGLRAYTDPAFDPVEIGYFGKYGGPVYRIAPFKSVTSGSRLWVQTWFRPTYRINTTDDYVIGVYFAGGHFSRTNTALSSDVNRSGIVFHGGFQSTALGWFDTLPSTNTNANAVDVLFQPD